MNDAYYIFYQSAMILSLAVCVCLALLTWRRRQAPGAPAMIALAVSTFVWALGFLLEANSSTLERQLLFNNIGYLGSMSVPVAWFVFSLNYTSGQRLISGWKILPFCVIPLVTVALIWSNNWHHLMWFDEHLTTSGPFTVTAKTYGLFFWIAVTHNYLFILTGAIILVRRLFIGVPLYAGQAISLIVAIAVPLIWNIIYVFRLVPMPRKDLTPVMFSISGVAITLGLLSYQLLRVVPFARKFLIERLTDSILVFDMDNHLLEANPPALKLLGTDYHGIGKKVDLSCLSPALGQLSPAESQRVELPLTFGNEERFCEIQTVPIRNSRQAQGGWLAIVRDVTESRRKDQEYKTIIQTTIDGFWLTDMQGRFLDVNDAYCKLTGYSREDLLTMRIRDIEAIEKPEETSARIAKIQDTGGDRFETRHRCKDGRVIDVEISVNYARTDGGKMFVFIRDITERKRIQEDLRRLYEREHALRQEVEAEMKKRGDFARILVHELKTPLTAIIASSELLDEGIETDLRKRITENIRRSTLNLNRRVSELLDISQGEAGILQLKPIEVTPRELFSQVVESMSPVLANHKQSLVTEIPATLPRIVVDKDRLQQVLFNLIDNAVKYSPEGGRIILRVVPEDGHLLVSVRDNGGGIAKDEQTQLFNPYTRLEGAEKRTGGMGLGLAICRIIVELHGGRIWVESEENKGSTFTFRIPLAVPGFQNPASEQQP